MCSRKNEREVVFAKHQISTVYSLVAVIAVSYTFFPVLLRIGLLIIVLGNLD